jgi:hypothetical protein
VRLKPSLPGYLVLSQFQSREIWNERNGVFKMKKILIGLSFVTALFSGDVVGGIELGKEVSKDKSIKKMPYSSSITCDVMDCGKKIYGYKKDKVKFFDGMKIEVDGKNIARSIAYPKIYKVNTNNVKTQSKKIQKDFKRILDRLEKKYGTFDKTDAKGILSSIISPIVYFSQQVDEVAINKNPKSENIGRIILLLKTKGKKQVILGNTIDVMLLVGYTDKYLDAALDKKKESELDDL